MQYKTPRMLARTLLVLRRRRRPNVNQEKLGALIGRSKAAISAYECRKDSITYEILDRYQCCFGAPNGVLLSISHVAAMAREASLTSASTKKHKREREKLMLMGQYLRGLSLRILDPAASPPLWQYPGVSDEPETWDVLLHDLFEATQNGRSSADSTPFEDHTTLKKMIKGSQNRTET